jgi:hypothetical protein
VAARAEFHEHSMAGMVMKMRPLAGLAIPAEQTVALAPGGMHIMLVGLKAPLREGQSFVLTLTFAKAGPQMVTVMVGKVAAMCPPPAHSSETRNGDRPCRREAAPDAPAAARPPCSAPPSSASAPFSLSNCATARAVAPEPDSAAR